MRKIAKMFNDFVRVIVRNEEIPSEFSNALIRKEVTIPRVYL